MFVLFEDGGKFLAGRILSESDSALQAELETGKRVKVKSANVLMKFDKPAASELIAQGQQLAQDIDLDLAWEFAPEEDFGFAEFASDYFQEKPSLIEQTAALFKLFDSPHYFRRMGKGRFKKAPQETVQAALAAIERKKQQQVQMEKWAKDLANGTTPSPVAEQLYKILFKPDKNSLEYKAVVEASRQSQKAPLELLRQAGAITSPYQFHWKRFLFENFPKGTKFPDLPIPAYKEELTLSPVQAFSIDDSSTTEIDDALSVQGLGSGTVTFGIHIAAPGLAIQPGSPWDHWARTRLSTVYMPGYKLTMLPDELVQSFTLQEGCDCPAVSVYFQMDEATLEIKSHHTVVNKVHIAANLRHDKLDGIVTEETLTGQKHAAYPFADELAFTYRLAKQLKAQREIFRGKPETFNRPDYNFKLVGNGLNHDQEPQGQETVQILIRPRGTLLDLIVAEAMILANSTWGGLLAELAHKYLHKGSLVFIEGRLRTRNWEDKEKIRRYATEIVGDNLVMLDKRKDSNGSEAHGGNAAEHTPGDEGPGFTTDALPDHTADHHPIRDTNALPF